MPYTADGRSRYGLRPLPYQILLFRADDFSSFSVVFCIFAALQENVTAMQESIVLDPAFVSEGIPYSREEIIADYRLMYQSRQASLIGRKEVLTGKAKFGIFGDGKELPQIALSKVFQPGDFRAGYYRDQTIALATGMVTVKQFFAQLYADPNVEHDPHSAGRQMNAHFATRHLDEAGNWKRLMDLKMSTADASPTASQMPRMVGVAQASKLYRAQPELAAQMNDFTDNGNEIMFGSIGNASCAEGIFFETINAVGVLQVPLVMSVWDDGYGISVPNHMQVTKSNISEILKGFQRDENGKGFEIMVVKAWDYLALRETYWKAAYIARTEHVPVLVHVIEVTQPQGHSTSGSHERYKTKERLAWEQDYDCLTKMRAWILETGIATEEELQNWEDLDMGFVRQSKEDAWLDYLQPIKAEISELASLIDDARIETGLAALEKIAADLRTLGSPFRANVAEAAHKALLVIRDRTSPACERLRTYKREFDRDWNAAFDRYQYSESPQAVTNIPEVKPVYGDNPQMLPGFEILNKAFDLLFARDPRVLAFGEDVGFLGDVNQGFKGLQEKYGDLRVTDTGIREATIAGQAIGLALRGLRPIAEMQYLDYLLYALQILSDDLASLHYRTAGGQKAPVIIRTRGHRLEGVWHAGSPMGMMLHSLRGVHILVPRNMVQAAGFYNTLIQSDEPAVVVEVLNGYRLREAMPENLDTFTVPVGVPEVLRQGTDVTVVTYGACCRVVMEAAEQLAELGISTQVIDVQSLLPFDRHHSIVEQLKQTNRIVFVDEDVPGGATSFMMQQVLEVQGGYRFLDSEPRTVTAKEHRPAYGTDGDYFSKPQPEHVFRAIFELMQEAEPQRFPQVLF